MDLEKNKELNNQDEKSFAELLNESFVGQGRLRPGEKIRAYIVNITPEWIFIDLGSKSEGYIARQELVDENGELTVNEGDAVDAYFLSSRNNERLFTTKIGKGEAGRAHLEEAFRSGIPIEGYVEKEIKGGFEIKVAGSVKGFCPFSQMGLRRVEASQKYVGRRLVFKIIEYTERGRKIILSNRIIREEELRKEREALKETLHEGMTVHGTVASLMDFGAFVDIGGVRGLIPISEIKWGRVENIGDILTVGQEVDPVIIAIDWDKNKITLSLKKTLSDPWNDVNDKYREGTRHHGKISRLTKFGAFIELEPGVDGLMHISKLGNGKRINHPSDVVAVGEELTVEIEKVDGENKRISLKAAQSPRKEDNNETEDNYSLYMDKSQTTLGKFGDLLKNKLSDKS
ncbi:MAG TPA: 30S ribosomal protein S1 [Deltaproteobacteria bacterium]|nr:30S ribosomal protein S1 [Deltaproteobacteria bacterium]